MTFREEYQRMRPLEDDRQPATVWSCTHRRVFDPIPFLLRQAGKASAWMAAERKFFVGPGSGRSPLPSPYRDPPKPKVTWYWNNWVSEDGKLHIEKAWI